MRLGILMAVNSPWSCEVALRLAEIGHEIHVIDFADVSAKKGYLNGLQKIYDSIEHVLKEHGVQVHSIKAACKSDLKYFLYRTSLRKICRRNGLQVLLILYGGGFATLAFLSGFRPYVIFTVGSDVLLIHRLKKLIGCIAYHSSELIFANGMFLAGKAQKSYGLNNVIPLYLGVDVDKFKPPSSPVQEPVIICTRGFHPIYNNGYLIKGLARMKNVAFPRVVFSSAGPQLAQVKQMVFALIPQEARSNIIFSGGVSSQKILEQLQSSSIYVSLSHSDGTSISLLEALACGLFPILSDIPQNREWIDSKLENGLLVPLDQPQVLAEALERAILDKNLRLKSSVINRQLILERANSRINIAILASRLEQIVAKQKTPQPVSQN